jgi:ADP-heptose:LPS heptosyltransferase
VDVLKNNPYIDEVMAYNPFWFYASPKRDYLEFMKKFRKRKFDLVLEARGDIRELLFLVRPLHSQCRVSYDIGGGGYFLTHVVPYKGVSHRVEYHLDLARYLGCAIEAVEWGLYLTEEENKSVDNLMTKYGIQEPFIAIHPGSRLSLKRWPAGRYGAVGDLMQEQFGMPVVVFGAENEKPIVEEMTACMKRKPVSLAGELSIRQFAGLLSRAALFICNDSAPMHIAAAMKTPTVAVFGPSKSIETGPYGEGHRVVEKDFPCRSACDENSCRHERYNACMDDIAVDDVFHATEDIIRRAMKHVQV